MNLFATLFFCLFLIFCMDLHSSKPHDRNSVSLLASQSLSNSIQVNLYEGDMFQQRADYMVIASNKKPKGSNAGGQAKAAWEALESAGDLFGLSKIDELAQLGILLEVGKDVAVTPVGKEFFGKTGCKALLHVAGPDCRDPSEYRRRNELLQSAYYNVVLKALDEASKLTPHPVQLQIVFPLLSVGVFNYPIDEFMKYCLAGLSQVHVAVSYPVFIDLYLFKTKQKDQLLRDFLD